MSIIAAVALVLVIVTLALSIAALVVATNNTTIGLPGLDGTDGTDGKDGTNGTNGTNGVDGAAGSQGPPGPLLFQQASFLGTIAVDFSYEPGQFLYANGDPAAPVLPPPAPPGPTNLWTAITTTNKLIVSWSFDTAAVSFDCRITVLVNGANLPEYKVTVPSGLYGYALPTNIVPGDQVAVAIRPNAAGQFSVMLQMFQA